jgi:hypothetical protein
MIEIILLAETFQQYFLLETKYLFVMNVLLSFSSVNLYISTLFFNFIYKFLFLFIFELNYNKSFSIKILKNKYDALRMKHLLKLFNIFF